MVLLACWCWWWQVTPELFGHDAGPSGVCALDCDDLPAQYINKARVAANNGADVTSYSLFGWRRRRYKQARGAYTGPSMTASNISLC